MVGSGAVGADPTMADFDAARADPETVGSGVALATAAREVVAPMGSGDSCSAGQSEELYGFDPMDQILVVDSSYYS
jgi:hypothetical protein